MEYRHGQQIPGTQYRFIREIGAGGHGTVYAVEHTFLEAPAVMKLLHAELIDRGDLAQRMTREAKTLAKLRHPNIVEVRDGGISAEANARPYFVMESLNGMPLRELLRHVKSPGGVGIMPALRIMIGVLEGLEHAHRGGVIHRDIKPDNIFLHRTSTDVTVPKILDFGIAHLLMAQRVTGNYFLGTPRYAAPEQLRGDAPTARTDIYAAGLVLYEMLTGEAPFAEKKEIGDILTAHLEQPLPNVALKCPEAPLYLTNFVAMLTAKNPDDRPPTAFAAAVGLREVRSRLESQQAGVLNNTSFKTEPTPMDNMLHAASRSDTAGLAVTREEPLMFPTGMRRPGVGPTGTPAVAPHAAGRENVPAGFGDTIVDSTRVGGPGQPPSVMRETVRHTPRMPGQSGSMNPPAPVNNSVAVADTEFGGVKINVDRSAKTNTSVPIVQRNRPNYDTEMLLRGLQFDPNAFAEPAEQAPPGSQPQERTTGAIAMSRSTGAIVPQVGAQPSPGMSPLAKQITAFCVTLGVLGLIGIPILWKVRKEYGGGNVAPATSVAPPPAASVAPPPTASAAPPATTAAATATPAASASAVATTTTSATTTPTPAPPPPATTSVVATAATTTATHAAPTNAPASKPRVTKPKIDPNDPSSVPME